MTLEEAITSLDVGQSNADMLAELKERTVVVYKLVPSGIMLEYLAKVERLSAIMDAAADKLHTAHEKSLATKITLESREGFDFALDGALDSLAEFRVAGLLGDDEISFITNMASKQVPEFPSLSARDVIAIRDPAAIIASYSNVVSISARQHHELKLTVTGNVPTDTHANILVRYSGGSWFRIDTIPNISGADVKFRTHHGEFIREGTEIKCQCQYNITMSLTATAV